ncbi:uncharacterized protein LOC128230936 [Mya arenaria]|uniref:uncharacterized protein LOC128230936 n=1 Tax=Mya arenaria TaxID=6604 RepID=UPI0022E3F828|nr:uncharacterized protein LOC128230936 [Mya arenaria]
MLRGLILILLCTQVGAFFNWCFRQSALDPSENRFVIVTLVSEECRTPIEGASFKQRCFGSQTTELVASEVLPGIYIILLPPRFVRMIAYKDDYRPESISVGRSESYEYAKMRCSERLCSTQAITLTMTSSSGDEPLPTLIASTNAVDVDQVGKGVFKMHVCSLPADVVIIAGNQTSTMTVTGSTEITNDSSVHID